jgi:hypothetical protein
VNRRRLMLLLVVMMFTLGWVDRIGAQQKSAGDLVWAMHVTIAPAWFDPAENGGLITPFGILDALHDAMVYYLNAVGIRVKMRTRERDRTKREALLHLIQQITTERVMFAPIYDLRGLTGVGPRVAEHTINSIPLHPFAALEDIRLKE